MNAGMGMRTEKRGGDIEIRLGAFSQFFTLEPSPFREGRLTEEAEEYLLQRVKDLPKNEPIRLVIHLPVDEAARHSPSDIAAAVTGHFTTCAAAESKSIRELFRTGRRAALIGFATLSVCLFLAWHITNTLPARPITRILQESFVILGWVSMWKPIEMFLYDWLPPGRRRRLFRRLAAAEVIVRR